MSKKKVKDNKLNGVALPTMSSPWNEIQNNNITKLKDSILMVLVYVFFLEASRGSQTTPLHPMNTCVLAGSPF